MSNLSEEEKRELIKAVDTIMNSYDAFLIDNKYLDKNTHKKEFELLIEKFKEDEMCMKAINWMKYRYDCYYKSEFENDKNSAFAFLKNKITIEELKDIKADYIRRIKSCNKILLKQGYISKDKIREFIENNRKEFGSRYNLLDYNDITYEYWIKADKLIKLLEESE